MYILTRLVGGIVIILMFMCKNRNELGKYPVLFWESNGVYRATV